MEKVSPYNFFDEALTNLDNGGRFYNVFTKANDGVISKAELGKVGGVFNNKQKMMLFFDLVTSKLDAPKKKLLLSKLDDKLQKSYKTYPIQRLLPSEAAESAILSSNAILTGVPKLVTTETQFNGFIMIPISTGSTTTFTMVPLIEVYDIYELRDESHSEVFIIAHARGKHKLPECKVNVAGIFKELKSSKAKTSTSKLFLEVCYYTDVA